MAWRIVQQPNGLFARFSEVVDDFTDYDMTFDEAIACCLEYTGEREALMKVHYSTSAGTDRWEKCLTIIRRVHGETAVNSFLAGVTDAQ